MITVVCFKWRPVPGYRSRFEAEHVRALRTMVARHYPHPHRFLCVTDDQSGLKGIETIPLWKDFDWVPSPHGPKNPSCYRRLKLFSAEAATLIGPRFVALDLDTVIVGDLSPLWNTPEDFKIWGETDPRAFYNGSMFLHTAGTRQQLWTDFDPQHSPTLAKRAGKFGSDQGWISYKLGRGEATWGRKDGVYSYRIDIQPKGGTLPDNARIVMFHGKHDPWHYDVQGLPWVRKHYGTAVAA